MPRPTNSRWWICHSDVQVLVFNLLCFLSNPQVPQRDPVVVRRCKLWGLNHGFPSCVAPGVDFCGGDDVFLIRKGGGMDPKSSKFTELATGAEILCDPPFEKNPRILGFYELFKYQNRIWPKTLGCIISLFQCQFGIRFSKTLHTFFWIGEHQGQKRLNCRSGCYIQLIILSKKDNN